MKQVTLNVNGMHCCGCENRVKNALANVDGVIKVEASHESGEVKLEVQDDFDRSLTEDIIDDLGFEVVK